MSRQPRHQLQCQCCGLLFAAANLSAKWCSNACRQYAYYQRKRSAVLVVNTTEARTWQGTAIERRQADGFVNATAMCQANGRRWAKYAESDRCKEYIAALAAVVRISDFAPVQSRRGGIAGGGETWIHPSLAIDLARWISPAFAVWMDGWFLESTAQPQPQYTTRKLPTSHTQLIGPPPSVAQLTASLRDIAAETAHSVQFELELLNTTAPSPLVVAIAEEFNGTIHRLTSLGTALAAVA
jgi:hypothetical protein